MIPYLLHVSILMAGCYIFYWLLLRKETFFKLNRGILLAGLLIPMVLPLITIPADWAIPIFQSTTMVKQPNSFTEEVVGLTEASSSETTGKINTSPLETTPIPDTKLVEKRPSILKLENLFYVYLIGVVVFGLAFLIQLFLILAKMTSLNSLQDGKYKIVELVKDEAPYSFWNTIFINPAKYDPETYEQILAHEKVHIDQTHYLDMLLVELTVIGFWFNPFVWLTRKAITNNLEFLTDQSMLTQGFPKQSYQMSLLKVSVPQHPLNLTTNYNQSFLKNRIAMMNTKKSSARSAWKYLFIFPILGLSVLGLNAVEETPTEIETIESPTERFGPETIEKTNLNKPEPSTTESETEENKALREEIMAALKLDNLLEEEAPVFRIFPNKILLNNKRLTSKLEKKYKAIFQKHGIHANKNKLLIVEPLVIMSGTFVGNKKSSGETLIDVYDEEKDTQQAKTKKITTTTTTTSYSTFSDSHISISKIDGKTYIKGNGQHQINGKVYLINPGEVTVIDQDGNFEIIDQNKVDKEVWKTADEKSNGQTTTTTITSDDDEINSSEIVEISHQDGKTIIKSGSKEILISGDDGAVSIAKGNNNDLSNSIDGYSGKYKHYFESSKGLGNFDFLSPSDILTSSTNRFWILPDFCQALKTLLIENEIIDRNETIILYYLERDGIFLNGQHLTGKIVYNFEQIARKHKIPLTQELHFELSSNQVIILDKISSINQFSEDLLEQLSKDGFISNKRKKMIMEISGNSLSVNGKEIPTKKYSTYFQLFNNHGITPSPGKTIETFKKKGKNHLQVGYSKDNSILGTFASF